MPFPEDQCSDPSPVKDDGTLPEKRTQGASPPQSKRKKANSEGSEEVSAYPGLGFFSTQEPEDNLEDANEVDNPNCNDVLINIPLSGCTYSSGNRNLSSLVLKESARFEGSTYNVKADLVYEIVVSVQQQSPPGRFLQWNPSRYAWSAVSQHRACLYVLELFLKTPQNCFSGDSASIAKRWGRLISSSLWKKRQATARVTLGGASTLDSSDDAPSGSNARFNNEVPNVEVGTNGEEEGKKAKVSIDSVGQPIRNKDCHVSEDAPRQFSNYKDLHGEPIDDTVVEVALYKYEEFYGLAPGSAEFVDVGSTTDGIRGWASKRDWCKDRHGEAIDDTVVEVALYNYETFYGLKPGSAIFDVVDATSAGIQGWASAVLREDSPPDDNVEHKKEAGDMERSARENEDCLAASTTKSLAPGDDQESRQLQAALLESLGVNTAQQEITYEYTNSSEQEDAFGYDYEDDEDDNNSQWSDNDDGDNKSHQSDNEDEIKGQSEPIKDTQNEGGQVRPRGVVKSSWQFQALMKQVWRPERAKSRGQDSAKLPSTAVEQGSPMPNCAAQEQGIDNDSVDSAYTDAQSWSEIPGKQEAAGFCASDDEWEKIAKDETSEGADSDDWSKVSAGDSH